VNASTLGKFSIACFVLSVACSASGIARADPVVTINSRNHLIPAILLKPAGEPKGAVILFAGGNGRLDIHSDGTIRFLQQNFLVRARALFARAGYATLVPDLARDMKQGDADVVANYRASQDYAEDINQMVHYMRSQGARKVWTIGTSRGTLSVANYVARYWTPRERTAPDGQIYTSGYWKLGNDAPGLTIWKLANGDARKLKLPTLLAVHNQDACPDTNPADLDAFESWLSSGGAAVSVMRFTGGKRPQSGPCDALSQHGFYGLDEEVVKRMTGWIGQRD
jgi:dienelactone hydrolase